MLPTLANVETNTLRNPAPTPTFGETASLTQTYGAPAWARQRFRLAYPVAQRHIPTPVTRTASGET